MKNSVIIEKINLFRNKFYLNLIIKGILLSIFFSINGFLLIVFLEHLVWFDSKFRQFIFWGFCISSLIFIIYNIIIPFLKIYSFGNIISNKQAANIIGEYFRDIDDKLLNLLELEEINDKHSDLLIASINQKTEHLNKFNFEEGEQNSIITIRGLGVTEIQNQIDQLMLWFGSFEREIKNFDKELLIKRE